MWAALKAYDWPGNVRELRNVIERCVLFADGEVFPLQWLQLGATRRTPAAPTAAVLDGRDRLVLPLDGSMSLDDMDRTSSSRARAREPQPDRGGALLGTTRQTLRYRVKKYGLKSDD